MAIRVADQTPRQEAELATEGTHKALREQAGDQMLKDTPALATGQAPAADTVISSTNMTILHHHHLLPPLVQNHTEPDPSQTRQKDQSPDLGLTVTHLPAGKRQKKRPENEKRSGSGRTICASDGRRKSARSRRLNGKHARQRKRKSGRRCGNGRRR